MGTAVHTTLVCPAARSIHPADDAPSVICGVIDGSNEGAEIGGWERRGKVTPVVSGTRDPATIRYLCAGRGVPGSETSYCACVLWRAQRQADWADRHGPGALRDDLAIRPPAVRDKLTDIPDVRSLIDREHVAGEMSNIGLG